ncbi:MAG: NAD(P)H-hydrate epimerase [Gemmatimonadota bacterium]
MTQLLPGVGDARGVVVPAVTAEQMIEVDRAMIEDFGIDLARMMEHAGRHLAHLARVRFLEGDPRGRGVAVLAGTGGNGGGALVAARRLSGWGAEVTAYLLDEDRLGAVPEEQRRILSALGVRTRALDAFADPGDLILDGLFGYGLSGPPRGGAADAILEANDASAPLLSLDVPSGVDATSGVSHESSIRADATLTLALPKTGLTLQEARPFTGELYVADISVPPGLYASIGLEVGPLFAEYEILRLG